MQQRINRIFYQKLRGYVLRYQKTQKDISNKPLYMRSIALLWYDKEYPDDSIVLNQIEFLHLIKTKKVDELWDDVLAIQAFLYNYSYGQKKLDSQIRNKDDLYIERYHYVGGRDKIEHEELFKTIMKDLSFFQDQTIFGEKVWKEEVCFSNKLQDKEYMVYTALKIGCFIEAYHFIQINEMILEFVRQNSTQLCLINIKNLKYTKLEDMRNNYQLQQAIIISPEFRQSIEKEQEENEKKFVHEIDEKLHYYFRPQSERQKKIKNQINQHSMIIKSRIKTIVDDFENQFDETEQEKASNEAFAKLNPNINLKMSTILQQVHSSNNNSLLQIKNLVNNFPVYRKRYNSLLQHETLKTQRSLSKKKEKETVIRKRTWNSSCNTHRAKSSSSNQ